MARVRHFLTEQEVVDREVAADRALYAVDPELACALGYVARRTRAGSLQQPTARAVRALPNVLTPSLTLRPMELMTRLTGSQRMVGGPFIPLAFRSGLLGV